MTYRGVDSVIAELQHDEVAAAVDFKDRDVGLQGRIKTKGLTSEKVAEGIFMGWTAEVSLRDRNRAYVELESATEKPGKILCLFESWAFEPLAKVQQGDVAQLVCRFSRVEGQASERVPVFSDCSVGPRR
ncbi:MAG: hypothetical protein JWM82_803 [Myxococcales bacterium]|nr:hypothetical protein [Myxococcales bacterium]